MILALFDVDGTLVDAGGAGRLSLCRAFERVFGAKEMRSRVADVPFDGATDTWILAEFRARADISPAGFESRREELEAVYLEILHGMLRSEIRPRVLPGVEDLLGRLRAGGVLTGLVTGNIRKGAEVKLGSAGLLGFFETGAFGDDSADRSELARLARERFEARRGGPIDPAKTLLVGDSRQDVRAARANGYRSLAVGTGWTSIPDLEGEGPERIVADLSATADLLAWMGLAA